MKIGISWNPSLKKFSQLSWVFAKRFVASLVDFRWNVHDLTRCIAFSFNTKKLINILDYGRMGFWFTTFLCEVLRTSSLSHFFHRFEIVVIVFNFYFMYISISKYVAFFQRDRNFFYF